MGESMGPVRSCSSTVLARQRNIGTLSYHLPSRVDVFLLRQWRADGNTDAEAYLWQNRLCQQDFVASGLKDVPELSVESI